MGRTAAVALAEKTFHIDRPSWTPPGKDDGAHISNYIDENTARETLPDGKHVVLSSTLPLRVDGRDGLAPVDLSLREEGDTYAPSNPIVPIAISKTTGSVSFPTGVSVTPTTDTPEVATTTGDSVVLANSVPDTDFIVEPVPQGAELSWQLRSPESPSDNSLDLHLPTGASLRPSSEMPGGAEVVREAKRLLLVPPAIATDATGRSLTTSYSVSGSTLTTHTDLSGEVTYPVKVDPVFVGYYGVMNSANVWGSWSPAESCGGCFQSLIFANLIQIGANPGPAAGNFGEWVVFAPGWGQPGGAGITRVDVSGMVHEAANQSSIQAGIDSQAPRPVYSLNGYAGYTGTSPFFSAATVSGIPMAFCAQAGYGVDGGNPPLCDENYAGGDFYIADVLGSPQTVFNYVRLSGAAVTYWDNTEPDQVQFTSGQSAGWHAYGPTAAQIYAHDQGLGIFHFEIQAPAGHTPAIVEENISCNAPNGFTGCPQGETSVPMNLSPLGTGAWGLGVKATDPAGNSKRVVSNIFVDHTKPTIAALTGTLAEAANATIGNGSYTLKFSAEDGNLQIPQSGVRSIRVTVDGQTVSTKTTTCPVPTEIPAGNCFGLSGEWVMNGQQYGAGSHKIVVTAEDFVGNTETSGFRVTVNEAEGKQVGPCTVNLETGDCQLTATDVSIASADATLSVSRSYHSRSLEQGSEGPLGPQWSLSLPTEGATAWQSLLPLPEGAISLYTRAGDQVVFTPKSGGGWEAPAGYKAYALTEPSTSPAIYQLTAPDGSYTQFALAGGQGRFTPSNVAQSVGAGGLNKVIYSFTRTAAGIVEPTQMLAPEPSPGACTASLVKGCRALKFVYASSTTATGEARSEWGQYKGRLVQVKLVAWDPAKGEMTESVVAEYAYDKLGRLRAAWDPRISPALKETYGYDSPGHVTALTPPGQASWAIHYGAIAGDSNEGRVLSVARPSSAVWGGSLPSNTAAPALSGSPKVGVTMTVNNGTWSNAPIAYGYQWFDCDGEGAHCTPIAEATNPSYKVQSSDFQHTLVVQVAATNGGGTVIASTAHSAAVSNGTGSEGAAPPAPEARYTVDYRIPTSGSGLPTLTTSAVAFWGQQDVPTEGTAIFPPDEPQRWPASDYKRATIYYLDKRNFTVNVASPSGGITTAEFDSANGNLVRALSADNRATALSGGPGPESIALAAKLDTKNEFSSDGTELISTIGPEQTVKLDNGSTVEARKHTRYYYDEGATGQPGGGATAYRLVTKTVESALYQGEDLDSRTVKTSYAGQGWKLGEPTSTEGDPGNLDLKRATRYDETTGNVTEDSSPAANSETVNPPSFSSSFGGGTGSGLGQFKQPGGIALDSSENRWVVDMENNRVEKFSPAGTALASYGGSGFTLSNPRGIAVDTTPGGENRVLVADKSNNRIVELSSGGTYLTSFGNAGEGKTLEPTGVAVDAEGNRWVADTGNNRIVEYGRYGQGSVTRTIGTAGSGPGQLKAPTGIAISEGTIDVLDSGNNRVEQFSLANGSYTGQFGSKGAGPGQLENELIGIAANQSTGVLYVADWKAQRIDEFSPSGRLLTEWGTWGPAHQYSSPFGITVSPAGTVLATDLFANKATTWTPPEAGAAHLSFAFQFGSSGAGEGQFSNPIALAIDGEGNTFVTDYNNDRIEKFSARGKYISAFGTNGEGNGQLNGPVGIDINQAAGAIYVSDLWNHRIEQFTLAGAFVRSFGTTGECKLVQPGALKVDASGRVWVPDMTQDKIMVFSGTGECVHAYGKEGTGHVEFKDPIAIAFSGEYVFVSDAGNHRVQKLTNKVEWVSQIGTEGGGSGELYAPEGIATDAAGHLYVVDDGADHVEEFTAGGGYLATFATKGTAEGQLAGPVGDAIDAAGDLYVVDSSTNRVERWTAVNQAAHTTKSIYYSSAPNPTYPGCGGHAEFAGLLCQTEPAQQPQAYGLQKLPVTTYTYNVLFEPVTITDTVGSTTRTTTISYDGAGRVESKSITSSVGTPVAATKIKYSETQGSVSEESTSTKSIKIKVNTFGLLESYSDADGNTATYKWDLDERLEQLADGKGTQTLGYDTTTGFLTTLKDSAAGTFTGAYDVEGNLKAEGYPNGMNGEYARTSTGAVKGLEYVKTTHCSSSCVWYSDHIVYSIHEQAMTQESSLSSENYGHDSALRLTQVQETPAGKGCTTRSYGLDEDGNRTSLLTAPPGAEGHCKTEGATAERHLFDEGDRLADEGVSYDPFGNTTALPGADAGGQPLSNTFFVNNALASQTQNGLTITYGLDPADRPREAVSSGSASGTLISHYANAGDSPAWTVDAGGKWTRQISGIDGLLAAVQVNGGTPVLQLTNIHGDVVATAALSETETKLLSTADTTEYGVPTTVKPERFSYLGGAQRATELPTGIVAMGARTYVPQLGRFEQTDPLPGGSANAYSYTSGDPVDSADPSGEWTVTLTYDFEAAEPGLAPAGLPENFIEPWAIMPPPVDVQLEEELNAQNALGATTAFRAATGSRLGGCSGLGACAAGFDFMKFVKEFGNEAKHLYHTGLKYTHKLEEALGIAAPSEQDFECAGLGIGVALYLRNSPFGTQVAYGALSALGCASVNHR